MKNEETVWSDYYNDYIIKSYSIYIDNIGQFNDDYRYENDGTYWYSEKYEEYYDNEITPDEVDKFKNKKGN